MKITVTGARGRLGALLCDHLLSLGHFVSGPPRSSVDWSCPAQAHRHLSEHSPDVVVALASWTDVRGAQHHPQAAVKDTVLTAQSTMAACRRVGAAMHYVSTDYVLGLLRAQHGVGVYAASKLVAEQLVLAGGGSVARVAFTTPQQASQWKWVDGFSLSNRCWVEDLVPQVADWCCAPSPKPAIVSLGSDHPCTAEGLLLERYPEHPALLRTFRGSKDLLEAGVLLRPPDTSWD